MRRCGGKKRKTYRRSVPSIPFCSIVHGPYQRSFLLFIPGLPYLTLNPYDPIDHIHSRTSTYLSSPERVAEHIVSSTPPSTERALLLLTNTTPLSLTQSCLLQVTEEVSPHPILLFEGTGVVDMGFLLVISNNAGSSNWNTNRGAAGTGDAAGSTAQRRRVSLSLVII